MADPEEAVGSQLGAHGWGAVALVALWSRDLFRVVVFHFQIGQETEMADFYVQKRITCRKCRGESERVLSCERCRGYGTEFVRVPLQEALAEPEIISAIVEALATASEEAHSRELFHPSLFVNGNGHQPEPEPNLAQHIRITRTMRGALQMVADGWELSRSGKNWRLASSSSGASVSQKSATIDPLIAAKLIHLDTDGKYRITQAGREELGIYIPF